MHRIAGSGGTAACRPATCGASPNGVAAGTGRTGVAELARLCGLSRHHFMRAFRLSTGLTVAKYVEAARVSRAKTLLVASEQPIRAIAQQLGFAGAAAFATVFRRATGRTPSDYRGHRR